MTNSPACPTAASFRTASTSALERARRTGSQVALLLIDLDNFKLVNDTVGHHAGDELLKHVGNLFTGRVRRSDTVARTGGDEFSVILEEPMTRADAARVGKTLAKLLDDPVTFGGKDSCASAPASASRSFPTTPPMPKPCASRPTCACTPARPRPKRTVRMRHSSRLSVKRPGSIKPEPGLQTAAE